MIVIAYDTQKSFGGYGDRIVGLISCKMIAAVLNREFKILWTKENIKPYINYSKYDFENIKPIKLSLINSLDNQQLLKNLLINEENPLPEPAYKFYLNQEIAQYLYKNKNYSNSNYSIDILREYSNLYSNILIPTDQSQNVIRSLISKKELPLIGIQIRAGDAYIENMNKKSYSPIKSEETIYEIFKKIKENIESKYLEYQVFITSDHPNAYNIARKYWKSNKIIYFNQKIQHIDRALSGDFSKVFIDNYILSQHTDSLYISHYSNYGRIAALSSNHSNIFSLSCEKLQKSDLVSKHEILFK